MIIMSKQRGIGIIKVIALIPLVLIGLVILAFILTLLNKAYWDYRVRQMCEKDGGVEIFKHIEVTTEEFERMPRVKQGGFSGVAIFGQENIQPNSVVFSSKRKYQILHLNFPRVMRSETFIKRVTDQQIVASIVRYSRVGGDFPTGLGHSSSFDCPLSTKILLKKDRIFIIKEI